MGKFLDANGKLKNVLVLKAFSLSFLFVAVYALAFLISGGLVERMLGGAETGSFLAVWGPPSLIALAVTLLLCLLMLPLQDKVIVPAAFVFLAAYYLIFVIVLFFTVDAPARRMTWQLFSVYLLPVALLSNAVGWGVYALLLKRRKAHNEKRLNRSGA